MLTGIKNISEQIKHSFKVETFQLLDIGALSVEQAIPLINNAEKRDLINKVKATERKKQKLGVELGLINILSKEETVTNLENGKPIIVGSDRKITISHCQHLVAFALSKKEIGIDIHHHSDVVNRVQHKFLREEEIAFSQQDPLRYLNLLWCAKEAVFKIFGENVIFKNIQLDFDSLTSNDFLCNLDGTSHKIHVQYEYNETFSLCLATLLN